MAMIGDVAGSKRIGSAVGLSNALWQSGGVIVPSLVGYVFAVTQSFDFSFLLLAIGPLVGAVMMFGVPETKSFRPRGQSYAVPTTPTYQRD